MKDNEKKNKCEIHKVNIESLFAALYRDGHAKLSDHFEE